MSKPTIQEMTDADIEEQFDKAYEIYTDRKGGQFAVFDAVEDGILKATSWKWCEPCEIKSPILKGSCLVCGESGIEEKVWPPISLLGMFHSIKAISRFL